MFFGSYQWLVQSVRPCWIEVFFVKINLVIHVSLNVAKIRLSTIYYLILEKLAIFLFTLFFVLLKLRHFFFG